MIKYKVIDVLNFKNILFYLFIFGCIVSSLLSLVVASGGYCSVWCAASLVVEHGV